MFELEIWNLLALFVYILSFIHLRKGLRDSTSWFCLFFVIGYSGNILGYPLALSGNSDFTWLCNAPYIKLHGQLLLVGMISSWIGHFMVKRKAGKVKVLANLPALQLSNSQLYKILQFITVGGAILSIILSLYGYYGYYVTESFLYDPPPWLDTMKKVLSLTSGVLFLIMISIYQVQRRLGIKEIFLSILWIFAGFLTGFKTLVVLPVLYVIVAAWMTRKLRIIHLIVFSIVVVLSYSVIEPMRSAKLAGDAESAYQGMSIVLKSDEFGIMELESVWEKFLLRVDYTRNGVLTLEAYKHGRLREFKRRVNEAFKFAPIMAIVPRILWPDKPLADLGGVLSAELTGNPRSAITPSQSVVSYVWGGWFGVVFTAFVWGILTTAGGQIIIYYNHLPYKYAPFLLLAIVLSHIPAIMASYYINIVRMLIFLFAFYHIGRIFHLYGSSRIKGKS